MRSNEYDVLWLPEEKSLLFQLLGWLGLDLKAGEKPGLASLDTALLGRILGALPASVWLAPTTPQARLDATITIE